MSASERAIVHAQLALVKAMEGSFAVAHRWLYRWDDRMSIDAELQLVDKGVQQLRVITNLLATARRVVVGQQQTIDVLRSPSKRRRDAATGITEEDVTAMAFVASTEVCLRTVASND